VKRNVVVELDLAAIADDGSFSPALAFLDARQASGSLELLEACDQVGRSALLGEGIEGATAGR
jgi:hypothetical protein